MDLIREGVAIISERGVEFAPRFIPYFLSAFGCHCWNLVNRSKEVYYHLGRIPDCRLQMLMTAPPGFSKSLYLKQLFNQRYGLLNAGLFRLPSGDSGVRYMASCTEAGWTGSSMTVGGEVVEAPGVAKKYARGIVAMEEFAAISAIMRQEHSRHLEQSLNQSLFEGDVQKDLKGITISYHTDVTLMSGNQVLNFDISGGLFRRFFHIFWIPRLSEAERLKNAIWRGDNIKLDRARLMAYRVELNRFWTALQRVESLEFDSSIAKALESTPHFEQIVYRNFALGYNLMKESGVPRNVVIEMDDRLRVLLDRAKVWRHRLLADPAGFQVIQLISDLVGPDREIKWGRVREQNLLYSVDYDTTDMIIRRLIGSRRLEYNSRRGTVKLI